MKKIWIAGLLLVFLVPLIAVSSVNGAKPSTGTGTVSFAKGTVLDHDVLNQHVTIDTVRVTITFTGVLSGTANAIERDVIHNQTTESGNHIFTTFHGLGNFSGTLDGKAGSLVIRYNGHSNSTFERGHFTIGDGAAALTGVHGSGKFSGSPISKGGEGGHPASVNYTLKWQVHHAEGPQGEDKDNDHDDHGHPDKDNSHGLGKD